MGFWKEKDLATEDNGLVSFEDISVNRPVFLERQRDVELSFYLICSTDQSNNSRMFDYDLSSKHGGLCLDLLSFLSPYIGLEVYTCNLEIPITQS